MRRLIAILLPALALSLRAPAAAAQWYAAIQLGADRFWGGSVDTQDRSFRPYRPTTVRVGIERRSASLGVGLRLQYSDAAMALEGNDAVVAVKGVFGIYAVSPELVYRLVALGSNQLRFHVGPLLELWTVEGEDSRTRIGAQGAISLDVPIGGRFAASLDVGTALMGSPFNEGELGEEYELQTLWRRHFGVGVEYRL